MTQLLVILSQEYLSSILQFSNSLLLSLNQRTTKVIASPTFLAHFSWEESNTIPGTTF